jgi:hypothetical protein
MGRVFDRPPKRRFSVPLNIIDLDRLDDADDEGDEVGIVKRGSGHSPNLPCQAFSNFP